MVFEKKKIGEINQQPSFMFKKNIRTKIKKKKYLKFRWFHYLFTFPLLFLAFYVVVVSVRTVYDYSSKQSFIQKLFQPVLAELQKDEHGFVNVLLIGHGGEGHDGPELTDTMIVASLDPQEKNVVMLSIPRDFWLETKKFGKSRINEIYRNTKNRLETQFNIAPDVAGEESLKILMGEIEKIINMKIPYYAQVDFQGFIDVVDELGGITVNVERDIYDQYYPDGEWGYEVFELKEGVQELDGEIALKYVRTRHDSSDFDRSARQQTVIQAIKNKSLNLGILTSPMKIKRLFKIFNQNFKTNLALKEIITLAILSEKVTKDKISASVLNDDWNTRGGFLGTPPRADYGGAFVLIPYSGLNDYSRIHIFTELLFQFRDIQFSKFEVLNGTMRKNLATKAAKRLERYGFSIVSVGNTPKGDDYTSSELWIYENNEDLIAAIPLIQEIFEVKMVNKVGYYEETDVVGTFVIGEDFK